MSVSGHWILDEISGTSLTEYSGNSTDGSTDGTPSGTKGVVLTASQTITIPITYDSETSFGVFFFANPTTPILQQTLFTNSNGDPSTSLTFSINSSGIPTVNHGGNVISGDTVLSGKTHFGYVFDDSGHVQYLYINGTVVSTRSGISRISNNTNTVTMGEGFAGSILGIYTYSGYVLPSIVEGLATVFNGVYILPVGTVYGSKVDTAGDIVQRDVSFKEQYSVSGDNKSSHRHFVYNSALNTNEESSRIENFAHKTTRTTGEVIMRVRENIDYMKPILKVTPEVVVIESDTTTLSFAVAGMQFNSDDAGIYFGEEQEFRIIFDNSTPSRISFQNYDIATATYITRYSVANE
jgi:hypothetical protein